MKRIVAVALGLVACLLLSGFIASTHAQNAPPKAPVREFQQLGGAVQEGISAKAVGPNPEAEVRQAAEKFVEALANSDWKKFRLSFAEDATIFFPGSDFDPSRVYGRDAIVAVFEGRLKDRPREKGPPYLNIQPKDVKIQMLGDAAAVVTFHLGGDKTLGRRTLVFQRRQGAWLIAHLHASSIALLPRLLR